MEIEEIEAKLTELADKVGEIESKLDALAEKVEALETAKSSPAMKAEAEEEEASNISPSDVEYKEKADKKVSSKDGRLKCPKCGNLNIQTREDKTKTLQFVAGKPIYGKKFVCPKCGTEFK